MYIPVCPLTEANAEYLVRQRETFLHGYPGPDFPGGKGESEHFGRPTNAYLRERVSLDGLRAMGLEKLDVIAQEETKGLRVVVEKANMILGYA